MDEETGIIEDQVKFQTYSSIMCKLIIIKMDFKFNNSDPNILYIVYDFNNLNFEVPQH